MIPRQRGATTPISYADPAAGELTYCDKRLRDKQGRLHIEAMC